MEEVVHTIFETRGMPPQRRFRAWQEAICDIYVHVDVSADDQSDYEGYVREASFGAVTHNGLAASNHSEEEPPRQQRLVLHSVRQTRSKCCPIEFIDYLSSWRWMPFQRVRSL